MPKGVEHLLFGGTLAAILKAFLPLMPKGVEHNQAFTLAAIEFPCVPSVDAERR